MPKLRVFIFGAGQRVRNNFLPALHFLQDYFKVVGITARTTERLIPLARRWSIEAVVDVATLDWSKIDVVILSVSVPQNAEILRRLAPFASRLRLVIDTPIANTLDELAACKPWLSHYKSVLVTEDYMNFPMFSLIRRATTDRLIGDVKSIALFNIGYDFHGLALIRSFSNFEPVVFSTSKKIGACAKVINYHLRGGLRGHVIGPYRQHTTGGIVIEGTEGVISEFPSDSRFSRTSKKRFFLVKPTRENNELDGYRIENSAGEPVYSIELTTLRAMRTMNFEDKSELNLCRGHGLVDVFQSLLSHQNVNSFYGTDNAITDSFVSRISSRVSVYFDPLVLVGGATVTWLEPLALLKIKTKRAAHSGREA
ncbi:MAG: hypothetical protein FJ184_10105 [Gammaproteobacteria bacterium]|nr:hypothetical protein [Gammaproteobacteria bacterium]